MPRDSNGVYSLPAGNPVATLTVISSTWANTTLSDLSTAMTASLSRSGQGAMLAGLKLFDGTIGSPGLTWGTETTSGLYRAAAGDFRFAIGGVDVWTVGSSGFGLANGTVAAPSLYFASDTDTGIYRAAVNTIGFSGGGVAGLLVDGGHIYIGDGVAATPGFTFISDQDTGIYRIGANSIGVSTAGVLLLTMDSSSLTMGAAKFLNIADGAVGTPGLVFATDPDTGIYRIGANSGGLSAGGALIASWSAAGVGLLNGTAAAPAFNFNSDATTGIYRIGASNLGFSTGGTLRFDISTAAVTSTLPYIAPVGSAIAPAYTFAGDLNTGIFQGGADTIFFTTGGSTRMNVSNAVVNISTSLSMNSKQTSTLAAGNNNDFAIGVANVLRLTGGAGSVLTGMAGGVDGRMVLVYCPATAFSITDEDAASAAANRFALAGSSTFDVDMMHLFLYDDISSRWRIIV